MMWGMTPVPDLITTAEVARQLAVSADTVRRWVRDGLIEAVTLPSGQLRFRRESIAALVEKTPA